MANEHLKEKERDNRNIFEVTFLSWCLILPKLLVHGILISPAKPCLWTLICILFCIFFSLKMSVLYTSPFTFLFNNQFAFLVFLISMNRLLPLISMKQVHITSLLLTFIHIYIFVKLVNFTIKIVIFILLRDVICLQVCKCRGDVSQDLFRRHIVGLFTVRGNCKYKQGALYIASDTVCRH